MRFLALIALSASAAAASAQIIVPAPGPTLPRPTVLAIPAGARALGVGDAFVAGRTPEVLFYNPAQIGLNPGTSVSLQRYGDVSSSGSIAGVMTLPLGALGIGIQYLRFTEGPLGVRSPLVFDSRGSAAASSLAASLGYSLPTIKSIRSGVTAKFFDEQVGNRRDGGTAFDVGLSRDFFGRATLAFAAQNLGTAMQIDGIEAALPTRYSLGGSVFSPPFATYFDAAAMASVAYSDEGDVVPAGGVELSYVPLDGWAFTARVGGRRVTAREGASELTLGLAVSLDRVSLDWAFHPSNASGVSASHRFGLRVR